MPPLNMASISAVMSGYVQRVAVPPGQYVSAHIQTAGRRQRTLPEDAVMEAGAFSYNFAQLEPGTYRRYRVQTTYSENGDVAVTLLDTGANTTHLVRHSAYFLDAELKKGKEEE